MGREVFSEKVHRTERAEEDGEELPFMHMVNERILFLAGYVEEQSIAHTTAGLFMMLRRNPRKPIKLIINTYGGSVYEMFALYDAIKYVQSVGCPVHTVGLGKIMSAGVLLLSAGEKGNRMIGPNASIMYHMGHSSADGNVLDIKNEINEFERQEKLANRLLSENTNMSIQDITKMLKSKNDVYMTAGKAIELGIADAFLGSTPPDAEK